MLISNKTKIIDKVRRTSSICHIRIVESANVLFTIRRRRQTLLRINGCSVIDNTRIMNDPIIDYIRTNFT